jgi:hypothetical protein
MLRSLPMSATPNHSTPRPDRPQAVPTVPRLRRDGVLTVCRCVLVLTALVSLLSIPVGGWNAAICFTVALVGITLDLSTSPN